MMQFSEVQKTTFKTLFLLAVFIAVPGCGGGGAGSDAPSNADSPVGQGPQRNLEDLKIAEGNELLNVAELSVEVQVNAGRSFLSICTDPGGELDVNTINYDQCLLRAPLDNNLQVFKLTLPNHVDKLVAIVWFYETGKQPLLQHWQRTGATGVAIDTVWTVTG
jgi:hypothetical protein